MKDLTLLKTRWNKGILTLFLPLSQIQHRRHPTHSSWSCHMCKMYVIHTFTNKNKSEILSFPFYVISNLDAKKRGVLNTQKKSFIMWHCEVIIRSLLYFVSSRERPWRHWAYPTDTRCKTHRLCVNPGVPFWTREKTHKLRARWQASTYAMHADGHGRSRGETKYNQVALRILCRILCKAIYECDNSSSHYYYLPTRSNGSEVTQFQTTDPNNPAKKSYGGGS